MKKNIYVYQLKKTGWGTLYAASPCVDNMASFIYPFKKAVSDALWIIFLVKNTMYVIKN